MENCNQAKSVSRYWRNTTSYDAYSVIHRPLLSSSNTLTMAPWMKKRTRGGCPGSTDERRSAH